MFDRTGTRSLTLKLSLQLSSVLYFYKNPYVNIFRVILIYAINIIFIIIDRRLSLGRLFTGDF